MSDITERLKPSRKTQRMRVDAHQHFWLLERDDYHWMSDELTPLLQDYLPAHIQPHLLENTIAKTIVVQAAATVAETEYLLSLADENDWIAGVIGWIDFESTTSIDQIDRLAKHPKFKGVRPMIQDIKDCTWMLQPEFKRVFEQLEKAGLRFEALVKPEHLAHLYTLHARHPGLKLVVNHAAKPQVGRDEFASWAEDLARVASNQNAYCKLSGLLTEAPANASVGLILPYFNHVLHAFGSTRVMWGSDWPVLNLAANYSHWVTLTEQLLSTISPEQQEHIWGRTAQEFYSL